ncbi:bestrophin-like domain [Paraburkholderia silvatlantica]|uniref:DUF4239 domain-containing protein n=1 Tax=Paraburkholderia silvatlantica TaxID=321895 RepID=A0ABR6G0E7_9BURK|nr:hypothetical protein [Paraburkholderia silvatlantica]MBB2932773.1 hypothetical protein [Paraburkholderia silvatlantica]PVY20744.1 hypothetical protein C7411_13918 [Paraburkholderia silvatlantica]PXW25184.1 hypothetical protein C7413_14118 [Paraburkholderia silvatlantica]
MTEFQSALLVFALLLGGTGLGVLLRPLLPEEHRKHETVQLVQLVIGMLVTFAALVLSLLTASAKSGFDTATNDMRTYAADLIQLDQRLRDYGPDTAAARTLLRAYTASAIASTWTQEKPPPGNYYPHDPGAGDDELESRPFFTMLALWLILIFLSFGLVAPHNALAIVLILLGAVSISSAVYVIADLDTPFTGQLVVPSDAMRDALAHMNAPAA